RKKPAASRNVVRARLQTVSRTEGPWQQNGISESETRRRGNTYRLELPRTRIEKQFFSARIPQRMVRFFGAITGKFMSNSRCRKRLNKNRRLISLRLRIGNPLSIWRKRGVRGQRGVDIPEPCDCLRPHGKRPERNVIAFSDREQQEFTVRG